MGVTAVGLLLLEFALVVEMGRSGTYRAPLGSSSALLLLLLRVIFLSLGLVVVGVGFGGIHLAVSNLPADVALYTSEVFLAWRYDAASCNRWCACRKGEEIRVHIKLRGFNVP